MHSKEPLTMKSRGRIACIILAAGKSTRFGKTKQLFKVKGKSLVQRALDAANNSSADYVLLVLGADSSEILSRTDLGRAELVLNRSYAEGQSTSIKCGILNLPEDSAGAILMVADQPFLKSSHLDKMIQEFRKQTDSTVLLGHQGEPRNPVLVPAELFPKLLRIRGDAGAKNVVRRCAKVRLIEIYDEKVFLDIDTMQAASRLKKLG